MELIVMVLMGIGVFAIARELFCWYWKINKVVELLGSIDRKLDRLEKNGVKGLESESPVEAIEQQID